MLSVAPALPRLRFLRACGPLTAAAILLFVATLLTSAQTPTPPSSSDPVKAAALELDRRIITEAKDGPELMANLTYLSDQIGARLTGSASLRRANDWTASVMRKYGLSNVHLEPWTIPVGWERGTAFARIIEPDNGRQITLASMGWSPSTKGKIQGDVVVVKARTSQELAAYKGKLKGAIVLQGAPAANVRTNFTPRAPGERGRGAGGRGARGDTGDQQAGSRGGQQRGDQAGAPGGRPEGFRRDTADFQQRMSFRRELSEFLRAEGAACILLDAGKPQGLLNMTGQWRGNDRASGVEPIPSAFVVHEHYALLHRLASQPAPGRTRMEIEMTNRFIPGPIPVYNTIGEIRGSEKPDEVVIVGAHLDSWDLGQGTTDNGTGTCAVLETARTLMKAGVQPKRTIRFCLFTGEEQGLFGSKAYVQQHKDELPKISLCLVHDTGTGKVIGLGLQGRESIKPILESELVSLKELGLTDINLRGMGGSDHQSFENVGVPGFAVQQDMSEYNLTHHSQSDTLDKVNVNDLIEGVQCLAVAAVRVANLPSLLPRDKPAGRGGRGRVSQDGAAPKASEKAAVNPPVEKKQ